ncbi:PREDICTED: chorismate mutase 2 isoform X3 [Theobroma cacao]|uniref:chorismate mutase n=1 Tax=Theobroma cacao TaxID=3641 RepID=A0AB32X204_THECC|nr:PREDICTED: chorismate mutase 2 isoform X3 [Theobroma cacao]
MAKAESNVSDGLTLELIRESLIRQEDTIVFSLIERARFPLNSPTYDKSYASSVPGSCGSLVEFIVKETEAIQAKAGRYENPEEHPFFPDNLPPLQVPPHKYPEALSRRIHYGKLVAEVKFRDERKDYEPAIRAQDRDTLINLLTFARVEEAVKKRVEKKAMTFGQEVKLGDEGNKGKYKVNPAIVSRLYGDWVIPLTKDVEVEYLLHRLD